MLETISLSHRYPAAETDALHDVSLHIGRGECWGLIGHNGAGKTTLMSLLAGLQEVQRGEVRVGGVPFARLERAARQKIGLVPQDFAFYPQLSVWDNMVFFASLYGIRDKKHLAALLEQADLPAYRNKAAKHLSGGLKRRLNFAIGLINRPELLFLDEITVGIDPQSRRFIADSVAAQTAAGVTVVYTSHYFQEIESLCSRIAWLDAGRLKYAGGIRGLLQQSAPLVEFSLDKMPSAHHLAVWQAEELGCGVYRAAADAETAAEIYQSCRVYGIRYFRQGCGSLESLYLDFLKGSA